MVQVRFVGGPFDEQTHEVEGDLGTNAVIYWPPDATPGEAEDDTPGDDDVTEYIYQGDGTALYVGGLVDETSERPSA